MKSFKKRTIALVLASVVSVAGSFASERFQNSLMSLKFESGENGELNMFVETKKPYSGSLAFTKRDANTYLLTLPEMNSQAPTPDFKNFSNNIASVSVSTLPYTTSAKGYTRIVVKTHNNVFISAQPRLFIATENDNAEFEREQRLRERQIEQERIQREQEERARIERERREQEQEIQRRRAERENNESLSQNAVPKQPEMQKEISNEETVDTTNDSVEDDYPVSSSHDNFMLILGILLVLGICAYLYVRAKDKMIDLAGEKIEIDTSDEEKVDTKEKKTEQKLKTIKSTIKTLDTKYPKPSAIKVEESYDIPSQPIKTVSEENSNIVDLDELFQEKISSADDDENIALEEFLSGFSFNEEDHEEVEEEGIKFDEELYNSIIDNSKIKFSKDDIQRLNKLLTSEIQDDTIKNASNYLVSNPITQKPSIEKILEGFVTNFSVSNNINFTKDDIDALHKIITVELDEDFVKDLRVNPERTKQMEQELKTYHKDVRKPSKIKTLNVKKDLPDLSKVSSMTKKKVVSDYKVKPINYGMNCEVSTLEVSLDVDFSSTEVEPKEKETVKLREDNWETETLNISDMLPDLEDALLNPDKYKRPEPEKFVADENTLLQGLSHISFKPFDDGTRDFEIINDLSDLATLSDDDGGEKLSASEVQKELQKWNELEHLGVPEEPKIEMFRTPAEPEKNEAIKQVKSMQNEQQVNQVQQKRVETFNHPNNPKQSHERKTETVNVDVNSTKCVWENKAFNVVSSVKFDEATGCHLAKNETGYIVLGFVGDKLYKVKEYSELKSEKIQARLNEKLPNGHLRYLVRIGMNKFVVDVSENDVQYVIDLC